MHTTLTIQHSAGLLTLSRLQSEVRHPSPDEKQTLRVHSSGFSMLEMMVVLTLLLALAALEVPNIEATIRRTQETSLRDDLFTMRSMIDRFTTDNKRPPSSLEELVETGYLGDVPADPITKSTETWVLDTEQFSVTDSEVIDGVVDVHSGSRDTALDGTPYNSW